MTPKNAPESRASVFTILLLRRGIYIMFGYLDSLGMLFTQLRLGSGSLISSVWNSYIQNGRLERLGRVAALLVSCLRLCPFIWLAVKELV